MGELKYFFSYGRKDTEFVLKLAKELRDVGVNLWLDQLDILGGQRWDLEIEKALKTCQGMIVVLSPESVASHNVLDEVYCALDEEKQIVPVLLRPCKMPLPLRRLQYIDFATNYDSGLSQLLRALHIERPSQSPEPKVAEEPTGEDVTESMGERHVKTPIPEPLSIKTELPEPESQVVGEIETPSPEKSRKPRKTKISHPTPPKPHPDTESRKSSPSSEPGVFDEHAIQATFRALKEGIERKPPETEKTLLTPEQPHLETVAPWFRGAFWGGIIGIFVGFGGGAILGYTDFYTTDKFAGNFFGFGFLGALIGAILRAIIGKLKE